MDMVTQSRIPDELAARMSFRYPHLAKMAGKALALVNTGAVTITDERSGTVINGGGIVYNVQLTDDGPQCDCPSWQFRPAVINDHSYCKHTVALILALNETAGELTDEEPDDEEWYAELNAGYMRDCGMGNFR